MIFIIICLLHIDYFGDIFLLFDVMINKRLCHMKGMRCQNLNKIILIKIWWFLVLSLESGSLDLSENGTIFTLNLRSWSQFGPSLQAGWVHGFESCSVKWLLKVDAISVFDPCYMSFHQSFYGFGPPWKKETSSTTLLQHCSASQWWSFFKRL